MTISVVEMNEWGCGLYGGAGNLLTFVSFCDKNKGVRVICNAGYSPENTVTPASDSNIHVCSHFKKVVIVNSHIWNGKEL